LRDAVVSALRDGAVEVVSDGPARLAEVLDLLRGAREAIFHRLALDLLARHRDDELIAAT